MTTPFDAKFILDSIPREMLDQLANGPFEGMVAAYKKEATPKMHAEVDQAYEEIKDIFKWMDLEFNKETLKVAINFVKMLEDENKEMHERTFSKLAAAYIVEAG